MRKLSVICIVVFTAAALFAGCQATPEQPVVIQKDTEQMIEKALASPSAQTSSALSLREQLGVPDKITAELASAKGKLKIHADAEITVPDVTAIPAARIGMGNFTQDDVKRLYDTLCGDAMPVNAEDTVTTQAIHTRTIQGLLDQKERGVLNKYESMEELDAAIQEAMQEAEGAPEHFTRAEPDFSFESLGGCGAEAHIRVAPDDATLSELSVINAPEGNGASRVEYYRDLGYYSELSGILNSNIYIDLQTDSPYYVPPSMSEGAARKLAEDTVTALGLKDFVCSGRRTEALYNPGFDAEDAPRKGVYEFMFTRQIGGVTITYTNDESNMIDAEWEDIEKGAFAPPWRYEKVRIIIDDKGILCFVWSSPYIVTDIITDSSAMKPFNEIQDTFEEMMPVVDNRYDTSESGLTCDMYITEIKLGLMRVTEKDIGTSGLVIPVWDFMGYTEDSGDNVYGKDGYNSMLTINAIDGSIIDREFGY